MNFKSMHFIGVPRNQIRRAKNGLNKYKFF